MRLRNQRAGRAAGALCIATCAASLPAAAHADTTAAITPLLRVADRVDAGERVLARGVAPGAARRTIVLEHRAGSGPWLRLASTTVGPGDRFRLRTVVPRSGVLRAAVVPGAAAAAVAVGTTTNEQPIAVARAVRVSARRLHVTAGRSTRVAGRVAPAAAGIAVALQVRRGGRWTTLDRGRTAAGGRYRLAGRVRAAGSRRARVVTAGRDGLAAGRRVVGRLNVYRHAYASWYGPGLYGQPLGCGGTLGTGTLGVANKSLPCGTKVTLRHRGRSITVPVVDRGPYVAGREYDLTAATAQAIGFSGHGPLLVTR